MSGGAEIELRKASDEAARRGGKILRDRLSLPRTLAWKGGIDLVTDADRAAETEILSFLEKEFPGCAVLAEESGTKQGQGLRWVVDPLDGTTNYAHSVPHFCVSIGVEDGSGLLAGTVYQPITEELFSAGRGLGATLNGNPLAVSTQSQLDLALLCTGFPYDVRERPECSVGLFNHFIRKAQGIRRMGSAALDLAYVASGRFDGFFEFGLKPWDIAAGALLVEEAGGKVSDLHGQPLKLDAGTILACGPSLLAPLRKETDAFLKELGQFEK